MRVKLWGIKHKKYIIPAAILVAFLLGFGVTRALLGGTSSPVSSSDIELQRGLIGWWKMDGNLKDSTPYADDGINHGATLASDRKGASNSAYGFNGTSNYVTADGLTGHMSTGTNFTAAVWFKVSGTLTGTINGNILVSTHDSSGNNRFRLGISGVNGGIYISTADDSGATNSDQAYGSGYNDGAWHQVVAEVDGSGNIDFWVDGSQVSDSFPPKQLGWNTSARFSIGQEWDSNTPTDFFPGSIDDVRLYNRALSSSEISVLSKEYNPGLSLGVGNNSLVGWWKLDGNAKDSTPYGNGGTLVNSPSLTTDRKGRANSAYSFNGSSNYIQIPHNSIFKPTTALTLAAWINPSNVSATSIQSIVSSTESGSYQISINGSSSNAACNTNTICFLVNIAGTYKAAQVSKSSLTNGTWYHVVGVYNGSNVILYLNGASVNSVAATGSIQEVTTPLCIGDEASATTCTGTQYYAGSVDDVRVYSRALSATEVVTLYNSYDSQISLYQNSLGGAVNLGSSLLGEWDFNGNAKDATPYGNNGTVTGATLTSDREGRANSAYLLGNTSQWINVGSPSTYSSLSSALTYNVWLMRTGASTYNWPEIMGASNTHTYYGIRSQSFGDSINFEYGTSPWAGATFSGTTAHSLPVNQWHMMTVTYDGSVIKTYWDSALYYTSSSGIILNPSFGGLSFGVSSNSFAGSVDDARVWSRALSQAEVTALYKQYR